jgi:uncharacterized protein (TIGR03118 family)
MMARTRNAVYTARTWLLTGMLAVLSACGGGGSGSGYNNPPPPPPPAPSALSYTSPVTTNVGTAMTALNPTVTGSVTSYAVNPALPAGIALNTTSGAISGTPTAVTAQATYTVTASNATGSTTFPLSLTVNPPLPSAYTLSKLVSDVAGTAVSTDPHLKNPWGLAALPNGPMWVTNNRDRTSTIYDGTGLVQGLVVSIPAGVNGLGDVTGVVASGSNTDFTVTNTTTAVTAPARFIFATETGTISGWAPTVLATQAVVAYDDAGGAAVYKGLAIAANAGANFLYAADFRNRKIDVFNSTFTKVTAAGGFADPNIPADFAPFNIQAVTLSGTQVLVVTYAKQNTTLNDDVPGAGQGIVNIFDTTGTLVRRLVSTGVQLNSPWGVTLAPASFGTLGGALLIGNFGDGKINGFNPTTGAFLGAVSDAAGNAIVSEGLWGIAFGNGGRNQPVGTLYLAAGVNAENGGLYARIDLGATAPDITAPTGVAITAPAAAATVSGTTTITANATDNVGVARVVFSVRVGTTTTEIATDTTAPYSTDWATGSVANGAATLIATAFDAFGNSTAAPNIAVTVNNVPDVTLPVVAITAPLAGATVSGTVAVTADATDNVGVAQVRFLAGATEIGVDTTAPYSVQWNSANFNGAVVNGAVTLTAEARDGAGNLSTATATVTVTNAPTLAALQAAIFGPSCSGCHTGGGPNLPQSMNLSSTANTFAALVNVDSTEVPALKRVKPGEPGNSYVIHKVEGTQTVGNRMPLGGTPLNQATINQIRDWIQAGAAP